MPFQREPGQYHNDDGRPLAGKDTIAAQIDENFEQTQRGELMDADDAVRILQDRHAKRRIA